MFFLVAWTTRINSMWVKDVGAHGAGYVVRNIVAHIMTLYLDYAQQPQKIIMTQHVVRKRPVSSKKIIALEAIIRIALDDGTRGLKC